MGYGMAKLRPSFDVVEPRAGDGGAPGGAGGAQGPALRLCGGWCPPGPGYRRVGSGQGGSGFPRVGALSAGRGR
jgi:hypothetical protein